MKIVCFEPFKIKFDSLAAEGFSLFYGVAKADKRRGWGGQDLTDAFEQGQEAS